MPNDAGNGAHPTRAISMSREMVDCFDQALLLDLSSEIRARVDTRDVLRTKTFCVKPPPSVFSKS